MKASSRRPLNQTGFGLIEAMIIILIVAAIGSTAYLIYHHSRAAKSNQGNHVSFDTLTTGIADDGCARQTNLGCFITTDSQEQMLDKIGNEGYNYAHVEGTGYTDYESLITQPQKKIKALHVTHIDSIKGVGQKHRQ
ncbi:MAG TPA: hypothetical protein VHC21_00565 [Candidatus Saccharimonadales bacterium]|nr:hypothetical protein [Candidatus Saccharimonadales bacterium]